MDNNKNLISFTVKHKCGCIALWNLPARDDSELAILEGKLNKSYCYDCILAIKKNNSNPNNTQLSYDSE